jgi:hypothetical protein
VFAATGVDPSKIFQAVVSNPTRAVRRLGRTASIGDTEPAEEIVMTATVTPTVTPTTAASAAVRSGFWKATVVATVIAIAVTEGWTAVIRSAGVRLALDDPSGHAGTPLTFGACLVGIALCMIPGTALALALRRWAPHPAHTYRVGAVVLTALSLVPPVVEPHTSTATSATLVVAHLAAAAIIVPVVARRLPTAR